MAGRRQFAVKRTKLRAEALAAITGLLEEIRMCDELCLRLFGVNSAQLRVLCELAVKNGQSINELGEVLGTHQSTVSGVVRHLVQRRLVTKKRMTSDQRVKRVNIAPAGLRVARMANNVGRPLLMLALAEMPRSTTTNLVAEARKLSRTMKAMRHRIEAESDSSP